MLYIVATPIGNLGEITYRAVEVLREVDAVLCEDTRRTAVLLNRYDIKKPLVSYQKFNERSKCEEVISRLEAGENLALVSDAGMPVVSDPGSVLGVSLFKQGGKAYVSIKNHGPTIPEEELPLIFERFHKTDKSRSADRDGYGLGLYIVKTILGNHGEDIAVTSRDGVTEFVFSLTLKAKGAAAPLPKQK